MNRVSMSCAVALALGVVSAGADAASTLNSRLSTVREYDSGVFPYIPPYEGYSNSASYALAGSWSTTLPRGQTHTSTAQNSGVSGHFKANYVYSPGWSTTESDAKLATEFTITGAGNSANIFINGSSSGIGFLKQTSPLNQNAYVAIINVATNAVVFDSFDVATGTTLDPNHGRGTIWWTNVNTSVALSAGTYKVLIGAYNYAASFPGGGSDQTSGSDFNASVTFVPAPASAMLLGAFALIAGRRRRVA